MQALFLYRGTSPTPHHQDNSTIPLPQSHNTHPKILVNKLDDHQVSPAKKLASRAQTTKPTSPPYLTYTTTTTPLAPKPHKHYPIFDTDNPNHVWHKQDAEPLAGTKYIPPQNKNPYQTIGMT